MDKIKTDWNFFDQTHPDCMYLSWNHFTMTGQFVFGDNLNLTEKAIWHKVEILRINSLLKDTRSIQTNIHGVKWANKNAQSIKSKEIKNLLGKRRMHEKALKTIYSMYPDIKKVKIPSEPMEILITRYGISV